MSDLVPMIDTHQHLIYPERWPYSWTNDIPALAAEGGAGASPTRDAAQAANRGRGAHTTRGFRYDDYVALTRDANIAGTIFMETSPDDPHWKDETKFVYSLASQPDSLIKGVIANCRPEQQGFEKYVESVRHEKLVGFRRILHVAPDELSQSAMFAEHLRWLGGQELTFDLCFLARQLPIAIDLAKKCAQTQLILDHCGVPDIAGGAIEPWRENIRELAKIPNVACKISGVLAYCKPGEATIDAIRPYVDHCIECFGPDRLVWGSDWPVVVINSTLPDWIRIARQLVSRLSAFEQKRILCENAMRIYRVQV